MSATESAALTILDLSAMGVKLSQLMGRARRGAHPAIRVVRSALARSFLQAHVVDLAHDAVEVDRRLDRARSGRSARRPGAARPPRRAPRSPCRSRWRAVAARSGRRSVRRLSTSRTSMRGAWLLPAASTACGRSMITGPSAPMQDVELAQVAVDDAGAEHAHDLADQARVTARSHPRRRARRRSAAARRCRRRR